MILFINSLGKVVLCAKNSTETHRITRPGQLYTFTHVTASHSAWHRTLPFLTATGISPFA
jgi:hypothetical protein